jgi:signal transduction histidine kinase
MASIRHSLIAYFLILLALALVALSLLIDRFAEQAIRGREESESKRIQQEYLFRDKAASAEFDDKLLRQAQTLGGEFRRTYLLLSSRSFEDWQKFRAYSAMLTSTLQGPGLSGFNSAVYLNNPTVRNGVYGFVSTTARMDEIRHNFENSGHPEQFQFHIPRWKQVVRAPRQLHDLPNDVENYNLDDTTSYHFDTVQVPSLGVMRRVIFRTSLLTTPRPQFFSPPRGNDRGSGGSGGGGGRNPGERPSGERRPEPPSLIPQIPLDVLFPPVYVQAVRPLTELDTIALENARARDQQIKALKTESTQSLAKLRLTVALVSIGTFLALAIGGWLIIGLGLKPLRKLSEAVGLVSERDFKLPVNHEELSTELSPIHSKLSEALESLRQAFEREKQAVADISHELRTPVAALIATMDVSLRKPRTSDQYRTTIEECRTITKQLSNLVERVMTLAYLDAGNTTLTEKEADLVDLAQGCAAVIRPLADAQGITLSTDLDRVAELKTDPDKLREVMMNLLHNAVEYNKPGGHIDLRVRRQSHGGAVVEVTDTGIGMSREIQAKIFERFYRADSSRTTTGVHAGLGLAIVKEYVSRMGGTITVESEPGRGTTFRVSLPASARNHQATSQAN